MSTTKETPNPNPGAQRIAVVAIHGVGDHPPFEMARSVAALLQDVRPPATQTSYSAFEETLIRIDVEPVKPPCRVFDCAHQPASDPPTNAAGNKVWGPLDELYRSRFPVDDSGPKSLDHLFMEGQLSRYKPKGPEDNYQFLRLSGKRVDGPEVHVYDMYWADLSKLGNAFTQVFGELYQLLFHLASVGANTAKAAAISFKYTSAWKRFAGLESFAAAILAWLIPFLNLIMISFLIPALVASMLRAASPTAIFMGLAVAMAALITVSLGVALLGSPKNKFWLFPLPVALFSLVCGACGWWVSIPGRSETVLQSPSAVSVMHGVAALLAFCATLFAIWQVIGFYEKRRPGSKRVFRNIFVGFAIVATGVIVFRGPAWTDANFAALVSLRYFEVAFWMLMLSWVFFSVVCILAYFSGLLAVRTTSSKSEEERRRARGAHRTGWLVLGLSGTIFFLVSFSGWGILTVLSKPILSPSSNPTCYSPLFPVETSNLSCVIDNALNLAGLAFLPPLLAITLLGLIVAIWSFAPAVWGEVFPPDQAKSEPENQDKTERLGHWLTHGFKFLLVAGAILWFSLIVSYPVSIARGLKDEPPNRAMLAALGILVGGPGIGLLVLRGRLNSAAGGFRTGVRVALDVDAWLREHPRDSNPTGQICARYVSLLRHIANAKKTGEGYDAVIIFAHSQGTVITADLLRFLAVEHNDHQSRGEHYDPSLHGLGTSEIPIYLFTMGCPLRQLYSRRFPSLYTYGMSLTTQTLVSQSSTLGVIQWLNAYRSGDYVGRSLWSEADFVLNKLPSNHPIKDMCIGPGAHTHYWDHTASIVGQKLDTMIAGVGRNRSKPVSL